ncbi:MAG: hypothetical protein WCN87_03130 [Chlamydiota bacterium]
MANLTYIYAALMFMLGLLGFVSNPTKAMSALIVGAVTAVIFAVLGFYIKKKKKSALTILTVLGALLAMMLVWRTSAAWMAYLTGTDSKLVAALLTSGMLLITLVITGLGVSLSRLARK